MCWILICIKYHQVSNSTIAEVQDWILISTLYACIKYSCISVPYYPSGFSEPDVNIYLLVKTLSIEEFLKVHQHLIIFLSTYSAAAQHKFP